MASGKPANTKKSHVKRDRAGRWVEGTPSPNPAGRPPLGESWREIFTEAGKLTKRQLLERYPVFGKRLVGLPDDVPLKDAVALSALVALACEPSPGLLSAIMERVDGKVPTPVEIHDWREAARRDGLNPDEVIGEFERIIYARMGGGSDSGSDRAGGAGKAGGEGDASHI